MRFLKDCANPWRNIPTWLLLGQDIAEYGGVFKITEGFVEAFGERVRKPLYVNRQLLRPPWAYLSIR